MKKKTEKIQERRGALLVALALVTALIATVVGVFIKKYDMTDGLIPFCIFFGGCAVEAGVLLFNIFGTKKYVAKINSKKVADIQQYFVSLRSEAAENARDKLCTLRKIRHRTTAYTVVLFAVGFAVAVANGMIFDAGNMFSFFLCAVFLLLPFSRIPFSAPKAVFEEDECYIDEKAFTEIYSLVKKAADRLGYDGKIKVALMSNCNAGIAKIGDTLSVQLGTILLNVYTREELYNVLIHELAHVVGENDESRAETEYVNSLLNDPLPQYISAVSGRFFSLLDTEYNYEFMLYRYITSIVNENLADSYMAQYGDAASAATALVKLSYYDFFCWERGTYDERSIFESEELTKDVGVRELQLFINSIRARAESWNEKIECEILSRNASHPTLKMRLESLGISDVRNLKPEIPQPYDEAVKAMEYIEQIIYNERIKTYEQERKKNYLEPKDKIDKWKQEGCPVVAQEYADIVDCLRSLGRVSKAEALCDRAIEELDETAALFAYYMKGCFLLHRYDESGIDLVYKAIENNSNYIEEGLSVIGEYCCIAGKQDRLDYYRERAAELAQKRKDIYDKADTLAKGDVLVPEKLPEGMLEDILSYIKGVEEGSIEKLYLFRKVVTEDFFSSVFVVKFSSGISLELQQEVIHKIFRYLDTCSDWQFSLFEYEDVRKIDFTQIENSCVYEKRA